MINHRRKDNAPPNIIFLEESKMKKVCVILLVFLVSMSAWGDFATTPYIAGDFNGWNPGDTPMTETSSGSGIWEHTITGLAAGQYQQFKITQGDWDSNFPPANSWYTADGSGEVTVTFNANWVDDGWLPEQYRLGLSTDPGSWSVVGDYNGWNNADPTQLMNPMGDGIYMLTQTFGAGDYNLKPVVTGKWDGIGTQGRSTDAWNYYLSLTSEYEVAVWVDALGGTMKVEVIPEPATMVLLGFGSLIALGRKK
jgi:hypothetical protein